MTAQERWGRLAERGLGERLQAGGRSGQQRRDAPAYWQRLAEELAVIGQRNLAERFLVAQQAVAFANDNGIPVGPGRGSSTASLIGHALGISEIDPLAYQLPFERFLNRERVTGGDIELYVGSEGTDRVRDHLQREHGYRDRDGVDVVGLRVLKPLRACFHLACAARGDVLAMDPGDLANEDVAAVYRMIATGQVDGLFPAGAPGFWQFVKEVRPICFEDLVAVTALYRPGPIEEGIVVEFLARRHQRDPGALDPGIAPILASTHGLPIYQEQVMQLCSAVTGWSLARADGVRRLLIRRDDPAVSQLRVDFLAAAAARGFADRAAESLFEMIRRLYPYAFSRGHAVAHALITFQTAYLRRHFPSEFAATHEN